MHHNEEKNAEALQPALHQFFSQQSGRQWSDYLMRLLGLAVMSEEFTQLPPIQRSNAVFDCNALVNLIRLMEQAHEREAKKKQE